MCGLMHATVNTFMTVGAEMRAWHHFQLIHWQGQSHSPSKGERKTQDLCGVLFKNVSEDRGQSTIRKVEC